MIERKIILFFTLICLITQLTAVKDLKNNPKVPIIKFIMKGYDCMRTRGLKLRSYEMNMCEGPLFNKIILFAIPLVLSGILQLLFNAAGNVVFRQLFFWAAGNIVFRHLFFWAARNVVFCQLLFWAAGNVVFYWLKIKYIEKWKSNGEIIDVREFLLHKNVFSLVESKMSK